MHFRIIWSPHLEPEFRYPYRVATPKSETVRRPRVRPTPLCEYSNQQLAVIQPVKHIRNLPMYLTIRSQQTKMKVKRRL